MWFGKREGPADFVTPLALTRAIQGPFTDPASSLVVYVILGDDAWPAPEEAALLADALPTKAEVLETGTVGELEIRSHSTTTVLFAGDIVAGGKQDRTSATAWSANRVAARTF